MEKLQDPRDFAWVFKLFFAEFSQKGEQYILCELAGSRIL